MTKGSKPGPWQLSHDPEARPLGCNGAYGYSGRNRHVREGEPVCADCKASANHAMRERRRGQLLRRPLKPCGTWAAAQRHRIAGERLDFACRLAESEYKQGLRERHPTPESGAA